MRKNRLRAAAALLAVLSLTGCSGLSLLPTPTAPEPSVAYPTIDVDAAVSEQCRDVAVQLNGISRTIAQSSEAMNRSDMLLGIALMNSLQQQVSDLGAGVEGDAELQARLDAARAAADAIAAALGGAGEDPMAAIEGLRTEFEQLQAALNEVVAYCELEE